MTQHTPTPYYYEKLPQLETRRILSRSTHRMVADVLGQERTPRELKADAEFIKRACNSHDDLLAAAKAVYRVAKTAPLPGPVPLSIAEVEALRAAIAQAEEGQKCTS